MLGRAGDVRAAQDSYFYSGRISPPERCDVLSCYIPLVPINDRTGALRLVQGSHLHGLLPEDPNPPLDNRRLGWRQTEEHINAFAREGGEAVGVAMEPGDCTTRIPHRGCVGVL